MSISYIRYSTAIISCVLFLIHHIAFGQTVNDTLQLKEIEVVATRIQQPLNYQPTNVEVIDSTRIELLQTLSVAEILASQSSLLVKDHGPGGMGTVSQRGLSSEQIQVLWEGVPINSPLHGQIDLSLLPANFFSSMQVSSGTPSTAFGGGSLSGALYLGSNWKGGSYVSMRQSAGSFGQWQSSLQGRYKSDGLLVSVRGLYDYAENDFKYVNPANNEIEKRQHNRSKQYNVITSVGKEGGNSRWKTTFWTSDSNNQIPGNVLATNSKARQEDKSIRWLSTYQKQWADTEFSVKNYLGRLALNYFDPDADTRSLSTTRRWLISTHLKHAVNNHFLLKGEVSGELTGAETNNYSSLKTRQQFSALTNPELTFFDNKLRLYPALRLDVYSDFGSVLSPSLGANYELLAKRLFLRGQLSRDFNPPTFNALYWGQGGDPNLKAERSSSAEMGFTVNPNQWLGITDFALTGYYSKVDNGIRWYPDDEGIWTPQNVEQITTKGIEAHLKNTFFFGSRWQLNIEQKGNLTRTEISEARFSGDAGVGNQVRYIPQWKYKASLSLQRGIATALLQYRWVSRRYVTDTEDMSNSLDPYQVVDVRLQLQKKYRGIHFKVQAGINNILDENYEIIQWYIMPKRNYNFSLTATYQF